jgi:hypothetical protein
MVCEVIDWILVAQNKVQMQKLTKVAMNIHVPREVENALNDCATISFNSRVVSRRYLVI